MNWVKTYRYELLVLLITALGAFLRFWHFGDWSLTNDELSALYRTKFDSWSAVLQNGVAPDGHPALAQWLLYHWTSWFGDHPKAIRFPFVLASVLSLPLVFAVGKQWFSKSAGLVASLAMALLQYPLLYSRIARPYALGMFFVLLAAWAMSVLWRKEKSGFGWLILFAISAAGCAYTHYFAGLLAAIMGATGLILLTGRKRLYLLAACVGAVLLFVPHLSIFAGQLGKGGIGHWLAAPTPAFILEHIATIANSSWAAGGLLVVVAAFGLYTAIGKRWTMAHTMALLWFVLPVIIGFAWSLLINPVLQHSMLVFSLPFGLLLLFAWLPDVSSHAKNALVLTLGLVLLISTVLEKQFYRTQHFGVFDGVAANTLEWEIAYPGEITRVAHVNNAWYLHYYLGSDSTLVPFERYQIEGGEALAELSSLVNNSTTRYFEFAWSSRTYTPEVEQIIRAAYPAEKHIARYFNSGAILFARNETPTKPLASACNTFDAIQPGWQYPAKFWEAPNFSWDSSFSTYAVGTEYGTVLDTNLQLPESTLASGNLVVECSVRGRMTDDGQAVLVLQHERNGEQLAWYGAEFNQYISAPNTWGSVFLARKLPLAATDRLKVYVWNRGKTRIDLDDLTLEVRLQEKYR